MMPSFSPLPRAGEGPGARVSAPRSIRRPQCGLFDVVAAALPATFSATTGALRTSLAGIDVPPREVQLEAQLSNQGASIALHARLPRRFDVDPGDGHPMALRLVVLDSVDGSVPLRSLLTWYRHASATSLPVGVTGSPTPPPSGVKTAQREQIPLRLWTTRRITFEGLSPFADDVLTPSWCELAAARFLHIAATGHDAQFAYPFERGVPSAKTMSPARRVPGSPVQARTAWDACQALAWIAKERADPQERVGRMMEIPMLMQALLGSRGCA